MGRKNLGIATVDMSPSEADRGEGTLMQEVEKGALASGLMEGMDRSGGIKILRDEDPDGLILGAEARASRPVTGGVSVTIGSSAVSSACPAFLCLEGLFFV